METLLILLSLILLGLAARDSYAAIDEAKKRAPIQFRDAFSIRYFIDPFVWSRSCPLAVRGRYILSHIWAISAVACMAVFMWLVGNGPGAVIFGVITAIGGSLLIRRIRISPPPQNSN